tara:strand:+ start:546 stop:908 length:363 start_codon:yes stop_codon:yes gene_type:complete
MPDISPNCQVCGANPGERCGSGGLHLAARCPINISALDGMEDDRNEISIGELSNMANRKAPLDSFGGSFSFRRSEDSFESAWSIMKEDDSKYAGTSKCPCRQGYNPCDDPKCNEWHKRNN